MGASSSQSSSTNQEAQEYFEIERAVLEQGCGWKTLTPVLKTRMKALVEILEKKADYDVERTHTFEGLRGDIEAQYQLGFLYSEGRGVDRNDEKAVHFLKEACRRGHVEATFMLACLYYTDRGVPKETNNPQFNQLYAVSLFTQCAAKGHADAERRLGEAYMTGKGVKEADPEKAAHHFGNATHKSAHLAYSQIGELYETGTGGVEKDEEEAVRRYSLSAQDGNANAKYRLGSMYLEGRGVVKDREKAMSLIESALEQGNSSAQYHMAIVCAQTDTFRAIGLLNHAAVQGHEKARYQLMRIQNGDVIMDDSIEPLTKLQKSVAVIRQGLRRNVTRPKDIRLEAMAAEMVLSQLECDHTNMPTNSLHPHHKPHAAHTPHIVHSPKLLLHMRKSSMESEPGGSPKSSPTTPNKASPPSSSSPPPKSPGMFSSFSPFKKANKQVAPVGTNNLTATSVMSPTRASQAKRVSNVENIRFHP